jgi:outer membrane protein assembly factor BamB
MNRMLRLLAWIAGSSMLLGLAGCGPEEVAKEEWHAGPAVRTVDWPVDRGGGGLAGRVDDPVPVNPAVEWTLESEGGFTAPAVIADGVVYVGSVVGTFFALDAATGGVVWKVEGEDKIEAAACVAGDRVLTGSESREFRALDRETGDEIWKIKSRDKFSSGANVFDADGEARVLVNAYEGVTWCLRLADGSKVWSVQWDDRIQSTPALLPGGDRMSFGGCDASVHTLELADGKVVSSVETAAHITNTAATFGEMIYAGNHAGEVTAVKAGASEPEWIYKSGKLPFFSAPAVGEDTVFIGSRDKHLHAIDRGTGELRWKFRTRGRVDSSPLLFRDAVVFGSWDGRLYALDPASGDERWSLDLGEPLSGSPAYAGGRIFIGGNRGTLFAIRGKAGRES